MGPVSDFIYQYVKDDISRFHMPGHSGNYNPLLPLGGKYDITEIQGADALYQSNGIIHELERNFSEIYHATSVLSAGGSTLCIQTMLALLLPLNGKLLAFRNAHASFFNSCALLNIQPVWGTSEISSVTGLALPPSARQIEEILHADPLIRYVYLTSPDYYGQVADIKKIAKICHQYNALLLVDNAHGAHLRFLSKNMHPIFLGADMCCDSLHKTLPALTGAALLHTQRGTYIPTQIKRKMQIFGSSSPSYLILHSADLCASYLEKSAAYDWRVLEKRKSEFQMYSSINSDPSKLVIDFTEFGIQKEEFLQFMQQHKIECEYINRQYAVFIFTPFLREKDYKRLRLLLNQLSCGGRKKLLSDKRWNLSPLPVIKRSLHDAMFSKVQKAKVHTEIIGKISAEILYLCPPGIPYLLAGEVITAEALKNMEESGVTSVNICINS